ncbi:hypothetical protein LY76DRAFT_666211 [Colletotrichum caudatum]|nr:hypothetical protein LY76DRAFT_666211 [Colletotrichum caudatum]
MSNHFGQSSRTAGPLDGSIDPKGLLNLFAAPSEKYAVHSMMGSQINFGPGAKIQRISLPNDFTAIRIRNPDQETSDTSFWERLDALYGNDDGLQHQELMRNFTEQGVRFIEMVREDPHFAQNICEGAAEHDRLWGTTLSQDVKRVPSCIRWRPEPHVGITDARTVRLTWREPRMPVNLYFNNNDQARRLAKYFQDGQIDLMGGYREVLPVQGNLMIRLHLPLHVTVNEIRRQIPKDLTPNVVMPLQMVYNDSKREAELMRFKKQLDTIGYSAVELIPKDKNVKDGMTSATACFDFEDDARQAVRKFNNTIHPIHGRGTVQVVQLYNVTFRFPVEWLNHPNDCFESLDAHLTTCVHTSYKLSAGSQKATIYMESTDAEDLVLARRIVESLLNHLHREAESEKDSQLKEACRPQDGEPAIPSHFQCPVCLEQPSEPIRSACGHVYCKGCYAMLIQAEANAGTESSLWCIGNNSTCKAPFPLAELRRVLEPADYTRILENVVKGHVRRNPLHFRSCPTPKCQQLYRPAPKGANVNRVARCPDCLVLLCTTCHEPHDETVGCKGDDGEAFAEQMASLNIKACPRCKTFIERHEGCNHVKCLCCQADICWVCMADFQTSLDCYHHMAEEHGGAFAGIPGYDVYGEAEEAQDLLPPGLEDTDDEEDMSEDEAY